MKIECPICGGKLEYSAAVDGNIYIKVHSDKNLSKSENISYLCDEVSCANYYNHLIPEELVQEVMKIIWEDRGKQ
jgi:hypothetical protein